MNAQNKTTQPAVAEYDLEKLLHVFCQTAYGIKWTSEQFFCYGEEWSDHNNLEEIVEYPPSFSQNM